MAGSDNLTPYKQNLRRNLEAMWPDGGFQMALGFWGHEFSSTTEAEADKKLEALMAKYGIDQANFPVLKHYCLQGGDPDYSLIHEPPTYRGRPYSPRDNEIYQLSENGMTPKRIAKLLKGNLAPQYISTIIMRMRELDVNLDRSDHSNP